MVDMVCIFPKDDTTEFLLPLYDKLCSLGFKGFHVDTNENINPVLDAMRKAKKIVFLGHGTSHSLMGTPLKGKTTEIINKDNVTLLTDKQLLLLSCNSSEFCEAYSLSQSISFGMMPTCMEDVYSMIEFDANFPMLEQSDIDIYNKALVGSLSLAFELSSMSDIENLYSMVRLCVNVEITNCLIQRNSPKFRDVADLLQDLKNDCVLKL